MKIIIIKILSFFIFFSFSFYSMAEVVQLRNQAISINKDKIPNYSVAELKELQILKAALIKFVKSPSNEKMKLLTNKYKKTFKDIEKILRAYFDKETYPKIDFRKIECHNKNSATIKVNLYWNNEGYYGLQTFYFEFVKQQGSWLINWIIE